MMVYHARQEMKSDLGFHLTLQRGSPDTGGDRGRRLMKQRCNPFTIPMDMSIAKMQQRKLLTYCYQGGMVAT